MGLSLFDSLSGGYSPLTGPAGGERDMETTIHEAQDGKPIATEPEPPPPAQNAYYDREGFYLGTDGQAQGKIFLLNPNVAPNWLKPNMNWGGQLDSQSISDLQSGSSLVGGLILMYRTGDGADYTTSYFRTVGGNPDVTGYMLEPAGPDTTASGTDKRVPAGVYDIANYSSTKFPNNFIISNSQVPTSRGILIHAGNTGKDTEACLLPGGALNSSGSGIAPGTSRPKLNELRNYINSIGASNVKLIIRR
jgi:hypothetical protein